MIAFHNSEALFITAVSVAVSSPHN